MAQFQYPNYQQYFYGYRQPSFGAPSAGYSPTFPAQTSSFPPVQTGTMYPIQAPQTTQQIAGQIPGMLPLEQSYIENIFRLNKGKLVTVYAIFDTALGEDGTTRVFTGIVEAAGRDHLILSDPQSGKRYLIPMVYFGYAVFDEELDYEYPFGASTQGITTYTPR